MTTSQCIIDQLTEALEAAEGNHQLEEADREHFEARVRELEALIAKGSA